MGEGRTIRIGIDTGGTFTDVVALDEGTGEMVTTKTPSTPHDPAEGFLTGVAKVLDLIGADGEQVSAVCHGTTVATNLLLTDDIGTLGFITTEGYEHILEIARQSVPDGYGNSYFWVKPPRIVPAHRVWTVGGRLDHTGAELRPFDEHGAVEAAHALRRAGIDTVGVCFLHSYASDAHERRMRDVLAREHPAAVVSISSEVLREYREYERSVTTLVDASVKPRVARYVAGIGARLSRVAPHASFSVMKSNGGMLSAEEVARQPITTVLSGPAAGALGAGLIAQHAGFDRVLTLDGGGTSTDVSVVVAGRPTLTTEGSIGRYPSKIPMVDVVTVGAGGGSVAWVSPEGSLKVGPRSAGADPGPLCYGGGGTEVTVTDAHLALGRIPPHLLGGEIPLDSDAARKGVTTLAVELGLTVEEAARGVLEISAWNQANAIRQVTVKRGLDVRDFAVATFGGSGSLLLCRLVDILGLPVVLVPRDPGNTSAFGLLTVDVRNDYVQTAVARHDNLDPVRVTTGYAAMEDQAAAALDREGFARADHRYLRSADLRYTGQAFEVRVDAPGGEVTAEFAAAVVALFHDEHERLYGYSYRDQPRHGVEWVNLRVSGVGPITRPVLPVLSQRDGGAERAMSGRRQVCFDKWVDTPVYWRPDLAPGDVIEGPAIIEEYGSTVPLHPGFGATVDPYGNLLVRR
ncbi:MAG: 5-oxoprolinase [Pseudonocardiales bacterium]|nr:MAG: 5-oxoprolinase [Pseudonocardiales bacterium]